MADRSRRSKGNSTRKCNWKDQGCPISHDASDQPWWDAHEAEHIAADRAAEEGEEIVDAEFRDLHPDNRSDQTVASTDDTSSDSQPEPPTDPDEGNESRLRALAHDVGDVASAVVDEIGQSVTRVLGLSSSDKKEDSGDLIPTTPADPGLDNLFPQGNEVTGPTGSSGMTSATGSTGPSGPTPARGATAPRNGVDDPEQKVARLQVRVKQEGVRADAAEARVTELEEELRNAQQLIAQKDAEIAELKSKCADTSSGTSSRTGTKRSRSSKSREEDMATASPEKKRLAKQLVKLKATPFTEAELVRFSESRLQELLNDHISASSASPESGSAGTTSPPSSGTDTSASGGGTSSSGSTGTVDNDKKEFMELVLAQSLDSKLRDAIQRSAERQHGKKLSDDQVNLVVQKLRSNFERDAKQMAMQYLRAGESPVNSANHALDQAIINADDIIGLVVMGQKPAASPASPETGGTGTGSTDPSAQLREQYVNTNVPMKMRNEVKRIVQQAAAGKKTLTTQQVDGIVTEVATNDLVNNVKQQALQMVRSGTDATQAVNMAVQEAIGLYTETINTLVEDAPPAPAGTPAAATTASSSESGLKKLHKFMSERKKRI